MKIKKEREKKGEKEKVFNAKLEANKPHALSSDGGATKKIPTPSWKTVFAHQETPYALPKKR